MKKVETFLKSAEYICLSSGDGLIHMVSSCTGGKAE